MSVVNRGVRNAFRNQIRSFSIIVILGLSIGLALAMLLAHQAVNQKINSIKGSIGNTITISPAGVRGFEGGGNPLTQTDLDKVSNLTHVSSVQESLNDRLTSSDTNLQSAIDAGSLGQRFAQRGGFGGGFGGSNSSSDSSGSTTQTFTPPVTVIGTTTPSDLSTTQGGGTFKLVSGKVFDGTNSNNVALVGSTLATKNNLKVGSTFTAYNTTITVVGIYDSGNTFSNDQVIMPLKTVQTLSNQSGDITSAVVKTDSVSNVDSVTSAITSALGSSADVTNSKTQVQDSLDSLSNVKSISLYSLIGAVIAGAVIIFLTMLMIVRERRREIGVLKAIGASNLKIMFQFMTEAVTLTVLGAVVGILLGVIAGNPITHMLVNNNSATPSTVAAGSGGFGGGPRFTPNSGSSSSATSRPTNLRSFRGIGNNLSNIKTTVGFSIIGYGLAAALVIALAGSAVASWFIAKVRPAEVMRVE